MMGLQGCDEDRPSNTSVVPVDSLASTQEKADTHTLFCMLFMKVKLMIVTDF